MNIQKSKILIVLFALFANISFSQQNQPSEIGLGLVNLTKPNDFRDYKMPAGLYLDEAGTMICTSNEIMAFNSVPEVGIYDFICLEVLDRKYKVLINDTEIGYLPKNELYEFRTWEQLLVEKGVSRVTNDNLIHKSYSSDSEVIDHRCDYDYFKVSKVIERDGEHWIQVNYWPDCKDKKDVVSLMSSGYIQWQSEGKLLVTVFVGC